MKMTRARSKLQNLFGTWVEAGYVYDDGGRRAAGYKGDVQDCAVRATAIVMSLDYDETLHMLQDMNFEWHRNTICRLPWMRNRREENEGFSRCKEG